MNSNPKSTSQSYLFRRRGASIAALCFGSLLAFGNCAEAEDENYLWLTSPGGDSGAPGTLSGDTETVPFTVDVTDVNGETDFLFETTQTIDLYINIVDPVAPVSGSRVRVFELIDNSTGRSTLFQAASDANGNVSGSFTVNRTTPIVVLEYEFAGQTYSQQVDITYVQEIRRTLNVFATVGPVVIADQDGDGIPDDEDAYPDDPDRATTVSYPADGGYYTVAYEDLYPRQGDADFNDYVLRASYEADLNASGELVRLRGDYTHVARGAGYRHTLHLSLDGVADAQFQLKRYASDGTLESESDSTIADFQGVMILPASNTTISNSNTRRGGSALSAGKRAVFEIIPGTPVNLTDLGAMPFDLFLKVINTNREIHFLGRYFEADGEDRYLDSAGFPWALLVPGNWRWPYERQDVRPAYPDFESWYASGGAFGVNWYENANDELVVPPL
ncbi:MAG: LruC domain-containing protein [bacterium]|nr:LruC domain-containing protein [bacterium]